MDTEHILRWLTLNRFFLRDDFEIRRDAPDAFKGRPVQAWSLFYIDGKNEYRRVIVLAPDNDRNDKYSWAVSKAYEAAQQHLAEVGQVPALDARESTIASLREEIVKLRGRDPFAGM